MPIHIKGSGGSLSTPIIEVSSGGTITAKAGFKETSVKLSSEHDADFVPENIKHGTTIFGVKGTLGYLPYEATAAGTGTNSISFTVNATLNNVLAFRCSTVAGSDVGFTSVLDILMCDGKAFGITPAPSSVGVGFYNLLGDEGGGSANWTITPQSDGTTKVSIAVKNQNYKFASGVTYRVYIISE